MDSRHYSVNINLPWNKKEAFPSVQLPVTIWFQIRYLRYSSGEAKKTEKKN